MPTRAAAAQQAPCMAMPAKRRALVVLPTLNEARHIEAVLRSLQEQPPDGWALRFVVCDGGSHDGTQAIVQRLAQAVDRTGDDKGQSQPSRAALQPAIELHLLHNPKRIQSAAVNLAVRRWGADCEVLLRCDAHAAYPPRFIARLLHRLDSTKADAVVVPMDSVPDPQASAGHCVQRAVAWVSDTVVGSGGSAHRGGQRSGFVDHGHHAAFRMASFRRAGGYDESFTHNEDAELDCRQRALGSRIYLDADIRLQYRPRTTFQALARQYFGYGRGRSRTVRRHPGSWRLRQAAVPLNLVLCGLGLLSALAVAVGAPAWVGLPAAWPLLYAVALMFTSAGVAWRRRSLCGLWAGPAAGVMHLAWAAGFGVGWLRMREMAWQPPTHSAEQPAVGIAAEARH